MAMDRWGALDRAHVEFETRLLLVRPHDWVRPTPCDAWDVRALTNHVVGGSRRYTMLLHGAEADTVNRTRTDDHLGTDPVASFLTSAADVTAAFREDGALARIAHHPLGDCTGEQLLAMRVVDVTVHAWDLARGLGVAEILDRDLVEFAHAHAVVIERGRERGSFSLPTSPLPPKASRQARLIHLAGRRIEGVQS